MLPGSEYIIICSIKKINQISPLLNWVDEVEEVDEHDISVN